jgi:hypothetical protein
MSYPIKREPRIGVDQVAIESHGHLWKHAVLRLRGSMTIAEVRERPELWIHYQANPNQALRRGDHVTVVSADGLSRAWMMVVLQAEAGKVWLGKPLAMDSFEPEVLFESQLYVVAPLGTGYVVKSKRTGEIEANKTYPTVDAAKAEILRRQPTKAA